jgi:chromosome segregation ATPase
MTLLFALLFVAAAGAAFAFYLQFDAAKKKEDAVKQSASEASAQAQKASKELEAAKEELARRRTEAADLREKLNDLRSRTHKSKESEKKARSGAVADLQQELDDTKARLNDELSRYDVLSRDVKGMQEELAKSKDAAKKLDDANKNLQAALTRAQAAPAASASAAPVQTVAIAPPVKTDEQLLARVQSLETQLREARRKATEADDEMRKARGASSNHKRQFMVTKSELDLFREKLVWSEKRVVALEKLLFDNKIALPEREAAPQPKALELAPGTLARESANTGGEGVVAEAADYVPETTEAPAAATGLAAPVEAPSAPAGAEVVTIAAEPAPTGPQAVPPLRRPKAAVEGEAKAE